jgi:hypothetical protein
LIGFHMVVSAIISLWPLCIPRRRTSERLGQREKFAFLTRSRRARLSKRISDNHVNWSNASSAFAA